MIFPFTLGGQLTFFPSADALVVEVIQPEIVEDVFVIPVGYSVNTLATTTDTNPPYVWELFGTLPSGITFNPDGNFTGTYLGTLRLLNKDSILIIPVGTPYDYPLLADGEGTITKQVLGTLPSGISFDGQKLTGLTT